LRFNRYGQLLLDKKQKTSSNFVAAGLATFIAGLILYFALTDERFLTISFFGFAMMIPFSVMFSPARPRNVLLIYSIIMAATGLSAIGLTFYTGEMFNGISVIFIILFVGFQLAANYLLIKEDNR